MPTLQFSPSLSTACELAYITTFKRFPPENPSVKSIIDRKSFYDS